MHTSYIEISTLIMFCLSHMPNPFCSHFHILHNLAVA